MNESLKDDERARKLLAFFKKGKWEHKALENQLCYAKHLTNSEKFISVLRHLKKENSPGFPFLSSLYIYFFESYASFNSFKL